MVLNKIHKNSLQVHAYYFTFVKLSPLLKNMVQADYYILNRCVFFPLFLSEYKITCQKEANKYLLNINFQFQRWKDFFIAQFII